MKTFTALYPHPPGTHAPLRIWYVGSCYNCSTILISEEILWGTTYIQRKPWWVALFHCFPVSWSVRAPTHTYKWESILAVVTNLCFSHWPVINQCPLQPKHLLITNAKHTLGKSSERERR